MLSTCLNELKPVYIVNTRIHSKVETKLYLLDTKHTNTKNDPYLSIKNYIKLSYKLFINFFKQFHFQLIVVPQQLLL